MKGCRCSKTGGQKLWGPGRGSRGCNMDTRRQDDTQVTVKLMEVWRTHYDEISNKEFTWDRGV